MQPATTFFRIAGLPRTVLEEDFRRHGGGMDNRLLSWYVSKAKAAGAWHIPRPHVNLYLGVRDDEWFVNVSRLNGVDATDPKSLSAAETEGRRQVREVLSLLRTYLPGGEKIRLAFLRLFLAAPNFLLLDEPTTHLDLDGRRLLQEALQKYTGTILLVSHDIDFVRAVATSVLEITREGLNRYPGGYDYYCEKKIAGNDSASTVTSPSASEAAAKLSSKELRRQRAAERAKVAPQVKELKKRMATAEQKLDELQKALDEASAELFNPTPTTNFAEVNRQVRTLQFEIDRYTADWEDAAQELERMKLLP